MKKYIFNKTLFFIVVVLLVVVLVAKIYSLFTFPAVTDNNYKQLQKIDTTQTEFSFAVFGDNKNSHAVFETLIDSLNQDSQIDFVLDLGDLVYDGEMEKYRWFLDQIGQCQKPFLTVVGNHDIREDGRKNYYNIFGPFYYSFHVGPAFFIALDDANEIQLEESQMSWLKQQLKAAKNFKYKFILLHVPFYDPRKKATARPLFSIPVLREYEFHHSLDNKRQVKELIALFEKYQVTYIFASHIHAWYEGKWGGIPFTITGGAGAELVGNHQQHDFYHYLKITIDTNGSHQKLVKLPTPDFEWIDRLTHDVWIYIYSFFVIHFLDSVIVLTLIYLLGYFFAAKKEKELISNDKIK